jgi:hypothetical protein
MNQDRDGVNIDRDASMKIRYPDDERKCKDIRV